jgi:hypothetical protein
VIARGVEDAVRFLLDAAGLDVPDDERAALAEAYPALREALDALYAVEAGPADEPQATFRPLD